jgi:hypothetical protein
MATSAVYDAVIGALTLKQVESSNYQPGITPGIHHYSGGLSPQQVDVISAEPTVEFATHDLHGIVAAVNALSGLSVTAGTVTIPYNVRLAGGTFSAAGSAQKLAATHGLLVPVDFSANQDDETGAVCNLMFHACSSDGLADPVSIDATVTLDAQAFNLMFSLGRVKINSTMVDGVVSSRVIFGINVNKKRYEGYPYPTLYGTTINEVRPSIELTFEDIASMDAFGNFISIGSTVKAFYRKHTAGGTRVAEGTAEHIACTLTGGMSCLTGSSGQGRDNHSNTITVFGKTLAFASNSAIS